MDARAEYNKLRKRVHVVCEHWVIEDYRGVSIKTRNTNNDIHDRIDDIGEES